ncbi:DUF1127 domain-containing protein [Salinicola lusitanus]|uniref:DUF1127 domain-containing protein n=1 Tax=Salinicola lusitanus TaxID=1949085 RepID=UPI001981084D|nr:DUF1127 domain-containing protein [Salinicola lusitanus]
MRLALFSPLFPAFFRWRAASSTSQKPCTQDTRGVYRPGPWMRWRTRQQLAQLDARQLADIGLTRAQADREVRQAFWR